YARQSELLALRSLLAGARPLNKIVPILEPVNVDGTSLIRCIEAYGVANRPVVVVINPDKHQLKDPKASSALAQSLAPIFKKHSCLIPGFRCNPNNKKNHVDAFLKAYPNSDVALLYAKPTLTDPEVSSLAANPKVKFHVTIHGEVTAAQRRLLPSAKLIEVRDNFRKQARNADYGVPELFTDHHKTYSPGCAGFGDYAALGASFQASGSTPYAVAIHAAFKHPETHDIWVEHFVSDDIEKDVGDVASKYLQAATKLVTAAKKRPREFGTNPALDVYEKHVADSYFPGLPKNKEQQVGHHLCFMLDVLSGKV
ncbi:sce7725 family protein, partial [Ralstonia solanacearum]